nr:hypothetical protein [Candidatus Njordarchaeum guaymaensis]
QTVSIAVASASVTLAAFYYIWQIRHQTRIRKTELIMRLYSTSASSEYRDAIWEVMNLSVKDYQDYVKQYGSLLKTNSPMNRTFFTVVNLYESVGVLLYRKLVDLITVWDVWGSTPIMIFEKIKPVVLGLRKEVDPGLGIGFEYLCVELKRRESDLKKSLEEALQKIQIPDSA